MAEDNEVSSIAGGDHEDKTIKRSSLTSQNQTRAIGYLNCNTKKTFI